jgi:hypothetical protein
MNNEEKIIIEIQRKINDLITRVNYMSDLFFEQDQINKKIQERINLLIELNEKLLKISHQHNNQLKKLERRKSK